MGHGGVMLGETIRIEMLRFSLEVISQKNVILIYIDLYLYRGQVNHASTNKCPSQYNTTAYYFLSCLAYLPHLNKTANGKNSFPLSITIITPVLIVSFL